jgi:hypothetical protein
MHKLSTQAYFVDVISKGTQGFITVAALLISRVTYSTYTATEIPRVDTLRMAF